LSKKTDLAVSAAIIILVMTIAAWIEFSMVLNVGNQFTKEMLKPFNEMQKQSAINQAAEQQRTAQIAAMQYQAQAEAQRVVAHKASFEKNYQKPAGCDNPSSMEAMIECSNHYMREKKKFNAANNY
jgi:outer membrane protein TolC